MNEAEKEVLKTFKSGLGLTGAEQEILVNYIDKLQTKYEKQKRINLEQNQFIDTLKTNIIKLQKENQEYHRIKKDLIRVNKKIYDVDTIDEFIETIDKLQKENTELKEENQRIKDINVELNTDVSSLNTTIQELEEELDYYKQKENQDFEERDYYEE